MHSGLFFQFLKTKIQENITYTKASVVVPDFDRRYSKIWGTLCVSDDEVKLDGWVEQTCPHVALFCCLSVKENRKKKSCKACMKHNE